MEGARKEVSLLIDSVVLSSALQGLSTNLSRI